MKKLISTLLLALTLVSVLALSVFAGYSKFDKSYVGEGEFMVASFNGVKTFTSGEAASVTLEDACYWLSDYAKDYNIKYVDFMGPLTSGSSYTYANYKVALGKSDGELSAACETDKAWNNQLSIVSNCAEILSDLDVPHGVSYAVIDNYSNGYMRGTNASTLTPVASLFDEKTMTFDSLDDENYYYIAENNGQQYIIFNLEVYPRAAVLDWFNNVMSANTDKRAIVFTNSLIDSKGKLYTMWDWANGFSYNASDTTALKGYNITWTGQPRDGEGIWNYAFGNWDNLLCVITSNADCGNNIVMSTQKTKNGCDVATICANLTYGLDSNGALILMTKFSEDNKEIQCCFYSAYEGYDEKSVKTLKLGKLGKLTEAAEVKIFEKVDFQYNGANTAYMTGCGNDEFKPNDNMTRAEACTIFARLLTGMTDIPAVNDYEARFTDIPEDAWYYNAIAYLDSKAYLYRYTGDKFDPTGYITRAEFAELAAFCGQLTDIGFKAQFKDVDSNNYYYNSIITAAKAGLINGYTNGNFGPDDKITRGQVAKIVNKMLGLVTTDRYIDPDCESNFTDIDGNWAKNDILMATNSNMHSKSHKKASLNGITEKGANIIIRNETCEIQINKKNGKISKFIDLATGLDMKRVSVDPQFAYITSATGSKVLPTEVEIVDNRIKYTYRNGVETYFIIDVQDKFISVELDSQLPATCGICSFGNLNVGFTIAYEQDSMRLCEWSMNANTLPKHYISGIWQDCGGKVTSAFDQDTIGGKIAFAYVTNAESRDVVKLMSDATDREVGITSKAGGPYAMDYHLNDGDYFISSTVNLENLDAEIQATVDVGVTQFDLHQNASGSFIQGTSVFPCVGGKDKLGRPVGTAKMFKEQVVDKYNEKGIVFGLHTYAQFIHYQAEEFVADPYWQKMLRVNETYTLEKKISKFKLNIATIEDASGWDPVQAFFKNNSPYVLIDEEIIYIPQGTPNGFINVKRGQLGTKAANHEAGAKVYHLAGFFNMFEPVYGSELFYKVAENTAKAYNEGGFDMIYLDALDGISSSQQVTGDACNYYACKFVQAILKNCDHDPVIEYSTMYPMLANARGRYLAWDYATRAFKEYTEGHLANNQTYVRQTWCRTTFGWYNFNPDASLPEKNTIQKTLFHDDIDHMGSLAIAYNVSNVFDGLTTANFEAHPRTKENMVYYSKYYNSLRLSGYFSEEVCEKIRNSEYEHKVIQKPDGSYAFLEAYYQTAKFYDADHNTFEGTNPFGSQNPYVRVEGRFSTLYEDPIEILTLDETKELKSQNLVKTFAATDLTEHKAFKVKVCGNGSSSDAILICLTASTNSESGRSDYFIPLNFTGWREFICIDIDNADYDKNYSFSGISRTPPTYPTYRSTISYAAVNGIEIKLCGSCSGVYMAPIEAVKQTEQPIKNPTVTVGSSSITFNTELKGGEYIEYDPTTKKATLYQTDEARTPVSVSTTGTLSVPKGKYSGSFSAESLSDAPLRARISIGTYGQEIANPAGYVPGTKE